MSVVRPGADVAARFVHARARVLAVPRLRLVLAVVCVVALAISGAADYLTGRDLSLAVVYLVPIIAGTVVLGRRRGLVFCGLSLLLMLCADVFAPGSHHRGVTVVNDSLRFVIFVLVVLLVSALHDSVLAARAANDRARDFFQYAAHQLRTPLTAMSSAGQALLFDPPEREREDLLAQISRESARAGRLVTGLLRLARLDEGELVEIAHADVEELLAEELSRWRARWPQLRLSMETSADLPASARFAVRAAREILDNLLGNACRHARQEVQITASATHGDLLFAVLDDGPGLPVGEDERVFERFVSLDGAGGSGLGLAIARELARVNGGDVTYAAGAFQARLPLASA